MNGDRHKQRIHKSDDTFIQSIQFSQSDNENGVWKAGSEWSAMHFVLVFAMFGCMVMK